MRYLFQRAFIVVVSLTAATYSQTQPENERLAAITNNDGVAHFQKGDYDQAIKSFKRAIEIFPRDPASHRNLGHVYFELKDFTQSASSYREALTLRPDHAITLNQYGAVMMEVHRYKDALDSFRAADA
ncbi:MAG TPA: tetratricopeptide repeat protein, partial [Pyrinomonadaceae bacterium]|nr:tetratricopeptide repeat protein [Pyrinomonadaceae bacterium]